MKTGFHLVICILLSVLIGMPALAGQSALNKEEAFAIATEAYYGLDSGPHLLQRDARRLPGVSGILEGSVAEHALRLRQ